MGGGACPVGPLLKPGAGLPAIRHTPAQGVAADLLRQLTGGVEIDIEHGDLGAGAGELACGRGAEAGGAAAHDCRVSFDVHQGFRAAAASGFSVRSAMPCTPPMQAEAMP